MRQGIFFEMQAGSIFLNMKKLDKKKEKKLGGNRLLDDAGNQLPKPLQDPNRDSVQAGLISVIIPTYNEAATLDSLFRSLVSLYMDGAELIFCDGGSTDGTAERIKALAARLAVWAEEKRKSDASEKRQKESDVQGTAGRAAKAQEKRGAAAERKVQKIRHAQGAADRAANEQKKLLPVKIMTAAHKGRAWQMNEAADISHGDILFFLHCDSELPKQAAGEIRAVMKRYEAGCFGIDFREKKNFFLYTCKWISNHRVKDRKVMFGDQGIFMKRELFYRAGKYPELPIMEDYQLSLTLKAMRIPYGMTKHRIFTSPRRFRGNTVEKLRVMWQMNRLRAAYRRGVPIGEIAAQYRDIR